MTIRTEQPLALPLASMEATLELVGGKGASLSRLATAGFPVPPGFQLTTAAYRRFVAANDTQARIVETADRGDAADPAALDRAAATIQELFEQGEMPAEIATAIGRAYAELGEPSPPVAVRSSATAEDLPDLSFAGQQETLLNVRGEAALLAAVRRCWASLWTARAIGYRRRMGVDQDRVAMGVVVQAMVEAEVAGVLFTANPTSGDRSELIVNASFGLGEAIVAGLVTPDSYVVDKSSLATKEYAAGGQEMMVVPALDQGTVNRAVPEAQRGEPALSDSQLGELAALGVRVEQLFGGVPQDIEWAVAGGRLWLLQARPITKLPPAPLVDVRWEPPTPESRWIRRQVVEHMPDPLSPLFAELYLTGLEESIDVLLSAFGLSGSTIARLDRYFSWPWFTTVNGYAYMRADVVKLNWQTIAVLLYLTVVELNWLFRRGVSYWRDDALPAYLATIARWQEVDPATATDDELLRGVRELARADAVYWFAAAITIGAAKLTDWLLGRFLARLVPGHGLSSGMFLRGFPSKTVEADAELETIAGQIRGSAALRALVAATSGERVLDALARAPEGGAPLRGLRGYLERYGHQIYSLDFAEPTQIDDPLPVLLSLKALVERPGRDGRARQREVAAERDRLVAETAAALDPLRRFLFRRVLGWAQRFGPNREEALFYVGAAWPTLRRLALELGRRLVAAGSLGAADDVFFLESGELAAGIAARSAGDARPDFVGVARERRDLREARKRLHPPAAVPPTYRYQLGPFDLSSVETQRRNEPEGATLRGFAVSPGRVTAPASVIRSPADFGKMEPGTILVCPTTTPAWTPLFALARGLVTDIGGILAHGSIVAREYGIPAVMGTGTATQRIVGGQLVRLDGDAGSVTLVG